MEINKSIFRSYDIRGLYPDQINSEVAVEVAKSYLDFISEKLDKEISDLKIAVGYDIRPASKPLSDAFIETCLELGADVDELGLISVNDIYFATGYYKYDGGAIMTASHNPPGYGGMKMVYLDPNFSSSIDMISGKNILENLTLGDELDLAPTVGQLSKREIFDDHLKHVINFVDKSEIKPLRVVIDSGNGMNGKLAKAVLDELGCEVVELFSEPDGNFPNRAPNPLEPGAYRKCADKIMEAEADFGVMFDVDGDRMFLVDERGNFVRGDETLILMAKSMLKQHPGVGIAYSLICSHAVPEMISAWGGRPIRSEVGYRNLSRHMKESDGLMSGEVSGHFAFADNYYSDNGFMALALAVETISQAGKPLSELIQEFKIYHRGDEVNLKAEDVQAKLDLIRQHYSDNIFDEIDGITVEFDDWWFNVRPSNTEPLLRVTVEAATKEELEERTREVVRVIGN
jgi:phosphomannomutase